MLKAVEKGGEVPVGYLEVKNREKGITVFFWQTLSRRDFLDKLQNRAPFDDL
jgi:hypothetical protein